MEEDCLQVPLVISRASAKRKKAANNRCRGVLTELFAGCNTGLPPVVHSTSNEIRGNSFGNPISRSPTI